MSQNITKINVNACYFYLHIHTQGAYPFEAKTDDQIVQDAISLYEYMNQRRDVEESEDISFMALMGGAMAQAHLKRKMGDESWTPLIGGVLTAFAIQAYMDS